MKFSIKTNFDEENNNWQVRITGEVDLFNSGDMKTELLSLLKQKEADIFIDCSDLEYIDSTALGALVAVLKNAKEHEHDIYLKKVRPNIEKLFRITNLNGAFKIEGDVHGD